MNPARIEIIVDGKRIDATAGVSVAGALLDAGISDFRASVGGDARGPLCGMGVCYECRLTIDGIAHQRSCLRAVAAGMRIETRAST